jgi:hypothetical protein
MENKCDLSISMARASLVVTFLSLPIIAAQFAIFVLLHGMKGLRITWGFPLFISAVLLGIVAHELIHAASWVIFGHKPFSMIQFGFQWKTLTPYTHLKKPIEVGVYRIGAFMPGFFLGILPYALSLLLRDGNLFWFSIIHASAAGGDWLVIWLIRHVKRGALVEDHPTHAGCYVLGQ